MLTLQRPGYVCQSCDCLHGLVRDHHKFLEHAGVDLLEGHRRWACLGCWHCLHCDRGKLKFRNILAAIHLVENMRAIRFMKRMELCKSKQLLTSFVAVETTTTTTSAFRSYRRFGRRCLASSIPLCCSCWSLVDNLDRWLGLLVGVFIVIIAYLSP
jgi:hypothetical protein